MCVLLAILSFYFIAKKNLLNFNATEMKEKKNIKRFGIYIQDFCIFLQVCRTQIGY